MAEALVGEDEERARALYRVSPRLRVPDVVRTYANRVEPTWARWREPEPVRRAPSERER